MNREEYAKSIESVFISMLIKAIMRVIVTKLPLLASGPLNLMISYIVEKLVNLAAKEAEIGIFFAYTDFRVGLQGKDFSEKAIAYYKNKTPESEKEVLDAFRKFATFTG